MEAGGEGLALGVSPPPPLSPAATTGGGGGGQHFRILPPPLLTSNGRRGARPLTLRFPPFSSYCFPTKTTPMDTVAKLL